MINTSQMLLTEDCVQPGLGSFSLPQLLQVEYRPAVTRYCSRANSSLLPVLQMPQETELKQTFIQLSYFVRMNRSKRNMNVRYDENYTFSGVSGRI